MLVAKGNLIHHSGEKKVTNQTKNQPKTNPENFQRTSNKKTKPKKPTTIKKNPKKRSHHRPTSPLHLLSFPLSENKYLWLWSERRHCSAQLCNGIWNLYIIMPLKAFQNTFQILATYRYSSWQFSAIQSK